MSPTIPRRRHASSAVLAEISSNVGIAAFGARQVELKSLMACEAGFFAVLWRYGAPVPKPLLWESGANALYWVECGLGVIFAAAAIWSFMKLENAVPRTKQPNEVCRSPGAPLPSRIPFS